MVVVVVGPVEVELDEEEEEEDDEDEEEEEEVDEVDEVELDDVLDDVEEEVEEVEVDVVDGGSVVVVVSAGGTSAGVSTGSSRTGHDPAHRAGARRPSGPTAASTSPCHDGARPPVVVSGARAPKCWVM